MRAIFQLRCHAAFSIHSGVTAGRAVWNSWHDLPSAFPTVVWFTPRDLSLFLCVCDASWAWIKHLSNETIKTKDALLVCIYLIVLVCVYVCVRAPVRVSSFASACLDLKSTWVHFLDGASNHFIDTRSSSWCIDFPLVNEFTEGGARGKMSSPFFFPFPLFCAVAPFLASSLKQKVW